MPYLINAALNKKIQMHQISIFRIWPEPDLAEFTSEMCESWMGLLADRDPQKILDPQKDCGSTADEKLQTRTDADTNP